MIRHILCPIDFGFASRNAIEYAANIARQASAEMTLLNVQKVSINEGITMFAGSTPESVKDSALTDDEMKDYVSEIRKLYGIPCTYQIVTSMSSLTGAIAGEASRHDLTVIGTNGADNLFEFYFGSRSFRVAKKTHVPVLIVPETTAYHATGSVVFASDFESSDVALIRQLHQDLSVAGTRLDIVHISEKDTEVSREIFRSFVRSAEETLNYPGRLAFTRITGENVLSSLTEFMKNSNADVLAIKYKERGFFHNLTHQNLLKALCASADFPLLVLHGD